MMRRNVIAERLGTSLQRSPYVWFVATVLLFVALLPGLAPIAKSPGSGSTTLAIVATGFALYGIGAWVMSPRVQAKSQVARSPAVTDCILWLCRESVLDRVCRGSDGSRAMVGVGRFRGEHRATCRHGASNSASGKLNDQICLIGTRRSHPRRAIWRPDRTIGARRAGSRVA
jgi:hypothetical protein